MKGKVIASSEDNHKRYHIRVTLNNGRSFISDKKYHWRWSAVRSCYQWPEDVPECVKSEVIDTWKEEE